MLMGFAGDAFSTDVYALTPNLQLQADNTSVAKGGTVRVNVLLNDTTEITSLKLKLSYDANVLQLLNAEQGKLDEGYFMGSEKLSQNPYVMVWLWNSGCPASASLVTLEFKVSDSAAEGKTKITANVSEVFQKLEPVTLDGNEIEITVSGDLPGGDTPAGDTPGGDTPGDDTPVGDEPQNINTVILIIAIALVVVIAAVVLLIILKKFRKELKTNDKSKKENEDETMEN